MDRLVEFDVPIPEAALPPQNIDAEEAILGSILLDPKAIARVADTLQPEAFYITAHGKIYAAALDLHKRDRPTDLISMAMHLQDRGLLESVGGQGKLAQLVERCVSAVNIDRHALLVQDKFVRRQVIAIGHATSALGYDTAADLDAILDLTKQRIAALCAPGDDPRLEAYKSKIEEIRSVILEIDDPGFRYERLLQLRQRYNCSVKDLETLYFKSLIAEEDCDLQSIAELREQYGDRVESWAVHGWLPKGRTTLIHALGGTGKSIFLYDLAYALVTGKDWNGFPVVESQKVLLIQTDETPTDLLNNLTQRGFEDDCPNLRIKTRWSFDHLPKLYRECQEWEPDLIVIDSLTSNNARSTVSENDIEYARPVLALQDLAKQVGCAVALIHHSNKGGDSRGTSAIAAAVSQVIELKRDSEDNRNNSCLRIATFTKSRSRRPAAYKIELDPDNKSWKLTGEVGETTANDASTRDLILKHLRRTAGTKWEAADLAEELQRNRDTVRGVLNRLGSEGAILHLRSPGKPTQYWLPVPDRVNPAKVMLCLLDLIGLIGRSPADHRPITSADHLLTRALLGLLPGVIGRSPQTGVLNEASGGKKTRSADHPQPKPDNHAGCGVIGRGDRPGDPVWVQHQGTWYAGRNADQEYGGHRVQGDDETHVQLALPELGETILSTSPSEVRLMEVGDQVRYCGSVHLYRQKKLKITSIEGDWATISHNGWLVEPEVKLADLRLVP